MKEYGSGYFGRWITGLCGVPAYLYETNQLADPKALTMTNPAWNDRRNHIFAIGNDRLTAICSNFGYIQVRQDENCPKYLNDFHPENFQYGGGFGYLRGNGLLSTYFCGQKMRREYGAGYMRKETRGAEAAVEEIIFAPYGDDPVLLKRVKITNRSGSRRTFSWFDYMGGAFYQLTFTHYCLAQLTFRTANASRFRRRLDRKFSKTLEIYEEGAAIKRKTASGIRMVGAGGAVVEKFFKSTAKRFAPSGAGRGYDDSPPETAYLCLNRNPDCIYADASTFFGKGGACSPDYFQPGEAAPAAFPALHSPMILLEQGFELEDGGSVTLDYMFAYVPGGFDLPSLIDKYRGRDVGELLTETLARWSGDRVSVKLDGEAWVDRELIWHNAYLRGSMSYSECYRAHILSQGGIYQYIMGLQGAPRDQLQHALSFIYTDPLIAREHILFTLRQMSAEGEIPYATHGKGMLVAAVMIPSDLQLMLLAYAGEYILATRDYDFLHVRYGDGQDVDEPTVLDGLLLAWRYVRDEVGVGAHGLVRMRSGDWNDQAVYGRVPWTKMGYARKHGESVLNSALAVYAVNLFAEMLRAAGAEGAAGETAAWAVEMKEAVKAQWTGRWFRRAFMGEKIGWYGEDLLWLEPQPWAIICGAAGREQSAILAGNICKLLCAENPTGASLINRSAGKREDSKGLETGTLENGGIWPAINGYLIWALARVDGNLAYREWLKGFRAAQAEAYPEVWYGIWSGPDSINAAYARYPGRTQNSRNPYTGKREKLFKLTVGVDWEDFPVLNLHAHTWQQYTVFKLLGVEFSSGHIFLTPVIPKDEYEVCSSLLSLRKKGDSFTVEYNPTARAGLTMSFAYEGRTPAGVSQGGVATEFTMKKGRCEFALLPHGEIRISF